ncbi:hypothetical protein KSS87_007683 [Heliosperma pusillum]|nr:hypothetical protein KSS87_016610 [Heliosperma pusillum]KAH9613332.1 hypothetical protein KSS87_007683 [Heliosperma pusillum]
MGREKSFFWYIWHLWGCIRYICLLEREFKSRWRFVE